MVFSCEHCEILWNSIFIEHLRWLLLCISITSKKSLRSDKILLVRRKLYVMRCAIWYRLYNLKNVKNAHGGVLLVVKLQLQSAALLKSCRLKLNLLRATL